MNNIQKLIDEQIDAMAYAQERCLHYHTLGLFKTAQIFNDKAGRIGIHIQELTLLLSDKHTEAITEAAHVANTVLGEVCPHCGKALTAESPGADSSETRDVRQNLGQLKDGGTTDG